MAKIPAPPLAVIVMPKKGEVSIRTRRQTVWALRRRRLAYDITFAGGALRAGSTAASLHCAFQARPNLGSA